MIYGLYSEANHQFCFHVSEPIDFKWDGNTAHVKLKLTEDGKSVFYPGSDYCPTDKSPTRFSFALNVLGDFPFYSGK